MASTGDTWQLGHRPALDGLRGVAVLLVVIAHVGGPQGPLAAFGNIGVTIFFTLSGFLITTLLLEEHERHGRISLRDFYWRRAVRLFPAVGAFAVVMLALSAAPGVGLVWRDVWPVFAYCTNWLLALGALEPSLLSHTWSLAVEEQFYLVWPLLVVGLVRRRRFRSALLAVCVVGSAWSIVCRFAFWDDGAGNMRVYMGADTRADALLIGCALAVEMNGSRQQARNPWLGVIGLASGIAALTYISSAPMDYLVTPTLVSLLTACCIVAVVGLRSGPLAWQPLTLVGRRSYAVYLWHVPALILIPGWLAPVLPHAAGAVLAVAASWGLALLSWRFVERPFLRLKQRPVGVTPAPRSATALV